MSTKLNLSGKGAKLNLKSRFLAGAGLSATAGVLDSYLSFLSISFLPKSMTLTLLRSDMRLFGYFSSESFRSGTLNSSTSG